MWRSLWIVALIFIQPLSQAAPTSLGPTSDAEAEVLRQQGKIACTEERHQDCIHLLERLVHRYPGKPGHWEAQLLLGKALLALDRTDEAISFFKGFISEAGANLEAAKARIELGNAYLRKQKYIEAYFASRENEKILTAVHAPAPLWVETLLIKVKALLGRNREKEAAIALEDAEKRLASVDSSKILGKTYNLKMEAKIIACSHMNFDDHSMSKSERKFNLTEAQVLDWAKRRGICLSEAFLSFQKILQAGDPTEADQAIHQVEKAYQAYTSACAHPFVSASHPKKTKEQLRHFRRELADILIQECGTQSKVSLDLLDSWKPGLLAPMDHSALKMSQCLSQFISRTP